MHHRYLVALGSNVRHPRHGRPDKVLAAALKALAAEGLCVEAASRPLASRPVGPSLRRYANGMAIVSTVLEPVDLLSLVKRVEARFGRRASGQRWSARVLDLDIILWNGGPWASEDLILPHVHFRNRDFVLRPAVAIAGNWRDPLTALSLRHLLARLTRPRPLPIGRQR